MRALRYALDEAVASLRRGRQSGLLSTVTIALALFVLGGFLLVTSNLQRLGAAWSSAAEMSVYLKDEVTPAERGAIETVLASAPIAAGREIRVQGRSAEAVQADVRRSLRRRRRGGRQSLAGVVRSASAHGTDERDNVDSLAARVRQLPGVADVRYDRQWLDRLQAAIAVIRGVGFVLGAVLTIAAALTVANVVRLALFARRDELEIMQAGRAPQVYIRGPFVMEGILQGGAGALLALAALSVGFVIVRLRYLVPLASTIDLSSIRFLPVGLCVVLVVGECWWGAWVVWWRRRTEAYKSLTPVLTRVYTGNVSTHNPSRGTACHASRPIRGRPARSTRSQSSTEKSSRNTSNAYNDSVPIIPRVPSPTLKQHSHESWVSSSISAPKATPTKWSAPSSKSSTS